MFEYCPAGSACRLSFVAAQGCAAAAEAKSSLKNADTIVTAGRHQGQRFAQNRP
jgi:hypothetical protein